MTNRYNQAAMWPPTNDWDGVSRDNMDDNNSPYATTRYNNNDDADIARYNNYDGASFNNRGRRCRIVCDGPGPLPRPPRPSPRPPIPNPNQLLGYRISIARTIYPNIRVVVADGKQLVVTQDYNPRRLNVETVNNIISRIVGFY